MRATAVAGAMVAGVIVPAAAQPFIKRYAGHDAWAADHISSLAPEIRAGVLRHQGACGVPFAATQAFAVPTYPHAGAVTLHYEALWCAARSGGLCKDGSCLHEVYVRDHDRYRLSFRGYVRDVRVDAGGKVVIVNDGD